MNILQPIMRDFLNGMGFTAIGRKYSIDPRTAKRYFEINLPLEVLENRPFSCVLDSFHLLIYIMFYKQSNKIDTLP